MLGFLKGLIAAALLLLLGIFAVANRQVVAVSLEPLPFEIGLPLYLLVFLALVSGFLLGVLAHWLAVLRRRGAPPKG